MSRRVAACVLVMALAGCTPRAREVAATQQAIIPVAKPLKREVTDYVEFTGRTNAVESVNVVPRVTGYLRKVPFKEGVEVKAGELLAEIDSDPYQAQLDQADAQVTLYKAQLQLARTTLARDRAAGAGVSRQQLDQDEAAVEEALARVKAYEASTKVYQQNVDFTKVRSPIDGQVGRRYQTVGNLVNQDQTLVTTVVSLDPMHVYFDMDERTLAGIRQAINDGRIRPPKDGKIPVYMELTNELNYPRKGYIDFINNQVNPNTGSIAVRGVFDNPKPENGVRLMAPGMFVRIRLPIGEKHPAQLVIDRAISSEQGLKFVYVVNDNNEVEQRPVQLGALQEDGLRVITDGLKDDDWVVVGGLQQVRPKMPVQPDRIERLAEMPSYRPPAERDQKKK